MNPYRQFRLRSSRRRGLSTPALLMSVMMTLLFIVLAVELSQLSIQRHQMQISANTASRAAAIEAMDQRWLYLGPEGSGKSPEELMTQFANISQLQATNAFTAAQTYAAMKSVGGKPIALEEDHIELGWIDDPADRDAPISPQGDDGSWNTVSVEVSRNSSGGNTPLLWLSRRTGLDQLNVRVESVAMVDTRLHGFRPVEQVRVPLVPLAVLPELEDLEFSADYDLPEQIWWAKGPLDSYTVDTEAEQVYDGVDYIAEMVFRLRVEQQPQQPSEEDEFTIRDCAVMKLLPGGGGSPHEEFGRMAFWGLGLEELALLDGQITTGDDPPAMVPADFILESGDLNLIRQGLLSIRGRPRVWPVGAVVSSAVGEPAIGVIGFVAGSVVDCEMDENGDLLIVIQPCLLRTPTALTSKASLRNPWIGKLLFIR